MGSDTTLREENARLDLALVEASVAVRMKTDEVERLRGENVAALNEVGRLQEAHAESDKGRCFWEILKVEDGVWCLLGIVYDASLFVDQRERIVNRDPDTDGLPTWYIHGEEFTVRAVRLRGDF